MDDYVPHLILVEVLKQPSIEQQLKVSVVSTSSPSWMDSIVAFITDGVLLRETKEAERIQRISARFWLFEDRRLYQWSFRGLYLLCLHPRKVDGLLTKLHEGIYGSHTKGRLLAHRAMTQEFWWPNMQRYQ